MNLKNQHAPLFLSKLSLTLAVLCISGLSHATQQISSDLSYTIVDTNQTQCSNTSDLLGSCPNTGETGFAQDAQYQGNAPSYTLNENGTVTDNNTGLIWAQTIDTNHDGKITAIDKMTYDEGIVYTSNLNLAGYSDWRLPSIKELYSLILFDGEDPSGLEGKGEFSIKPFINHQYFAFNSGDTDAGERLIDAQYLSSTQYVSTTMHGDNTVFGVNFIDGRIKGYGMTTPRGNEKTFYVLAVRGNSDYGMNHFMANNNATVTDKATGLTWQQNDSGMGMDWPTALEYCENLKLSGSNWRLPNVKELQSIVDYTKSPSTSNSAAIDSIFKTTSIVNEGDELDYPNFWSSTTHINLRNSSNAAYVSFGRSLGYMRNEWLDVHGAGAQRSDPKIDNGRDYSQGFGPQGDAIRFNNYVRCVTDSNTVFNAQPTVVERKSMQFTLTGNEASTNPANPSKQDNTARDLFTKIDRNNDGKLSRDEVKGPLKRDFDRLDSNNDNYLTRNEIPNRPKQ